MLAKSLIAPGSCDQHHWLQSSGHSPALPHFKPVNRSFLPEQISKRTEASSGLKFRCRLFN